MRNLKHVLLSVLFSFCAFAASALAGEITYYHNDLSGSPVVATNQAGEVVWRESYRPYGERLKNESASQENQTWFTSRHQDEDTGLVYMGARFYNPMLGRFLSVDAVRFVEPNIHSFNRYAYANNNPYKYTDPDGRFAFLALIPAALEALSVAGVGYTAYDTTTTYMNEGAAAAAKQLAVEGAVTVAFGAAGKVAGKFIAKGVSGGMGFTRSQLQHGFEHAKDFGVAGNANNKTLEEFSSAINRHINAADTQAIQGTFRGQTVTHFVDPNTGLNVMRDASGDFLSGWKLSPQQLEHVLKDGKLGGGS